jgi:hypothetical protein
MNATSSVPPNADACGHEGTPRTAEGGGSGLACEQRIRISFRSTSPRQQNPVLAVYRHSALE